MQKFKMSTVKWEEQYVPEKDGLNVSTAMEQPSSEGFRKLVFTLRRQWEALMDAI